MQPNHQKKILIVHNYYQVPGGEDTVVSNEKKLLENNDYEVILYSRSNSELETLTKLQKLLLPVTTIFNPKTYIEVKKIIREQHINVVHVHNTLNLISPSVYYAAFRCKIPVVQTIHNFRLLCPAATFYRNGDICEKCVSKGLMCAVKYSCYRGSKLHTLACVINAWIHRSLGTYGKLYYICLTEFNKEKLLQLKQIKPRQIFIKPNFVEAEVITIPFDQRANQFVFAGRLDKLKGIDILLEAWKLLGKDASDLIICGTGPMEGWCRDFIKNNNLSNVSMLGFVSNEEARNIISNSKALILPTQWYEGFPMTIVESYSVGTPVIGSDIGNVGKIILDGQTGWKFQKDSAEELASTVQAVSDLVESTLDTYKLKYTEHSNYRALNELYQEVMG